MKFYGYGIVLDGGKSRLCKFNKGVFETTDDVIIQKLQTLGYKHDAVKPVVADPTVEKTINKEVKADPTIEKTIDKVGIVKPVVEYRDYQTEHREYQIEPAKVKIESTAKLVQKKPVKKAVHKK